MKREKSSLNHSWNVSPAEAVAIQKQLRTLLVLEDDFSAPRTVAGVDVGFEDDGKVTRAAVAVLDYPSLTLRETAIARLPTRFPYVPGLLSFREVPAVLDALKALSSQPELLLCDGQGYAHPRRMGIACHLGLITDIPSIGVGKSRLIGRHEVVPNEKGAWVELIDKDEVVGAVLRTRENIKPLYISAGHRISLASAIDYVMSCITRYKLPETTRWAHKLASDKRYR